MASPVDSIWFHMKISDWSLTKWAVAPHRCHSSTMESRETGYCLLCSSSHMHIVGDILWNTKLIILIGFNKFLFTNVIKKETIVINKSY